MTKQLLYLNRSTPEEFINAEMGDWIYLLGDITTPWELSFARQFGHAIKQRDINIRNDTLDKIFCDIKKLMIERRNDYNVS